MDQIKRLTSQKAVVVFSLSSCCMCHAIKKLFRDLGVDSAIYELDQEAKGKEVEQALVRMLGRTPPVPVVFIGGTFVGSTDSIMSLHLGGELIPLLRNAGAIWL